MSSSWDARIEQFYKFTQNWRPHAQRVYRRYEDERGNEPVIIFGQRVNLFYSNVHTLRESLFNSMPKPDVSRVQRGDFEDNVSRVAADVVRRGLTYEVECAPNFMEAMTSAIMDRLIPGIGQVWVTFDAEKDSETEEVVQKSEKIKVETVYWEDFLWEPAQKWSDVGWAGRRRYFTEEEIKENYGEDALKKMAPGGDKPKYDGECLVPKEVNEGKYCVFEIWDRREKKVIHHYKGLQDPLKEIDDPYKLNNFFPFPRPLIANVTTTKFLPLTDYHVAQDQYNQLDTLYCRIQLIVDAIKVAGLYDASNDSIKRMMTEGQNMLIPVDNWAMHAEKGGSKGQIDWFPVEVIVTVLQQLYGAFEATKAILYEITGMSDILRGTSNPYETKGAQEIKAQFASVRMSGYQRDVAVFVRDTIRIMSEMFTQLYGDEKILSIIGNLPPDDQQWLPQAAEVLRNDVLSKYKVNIQTNSLTQADWGLEKEQRMELVNTVGQMVGQITQVAQQEPQLITLGIQLIKFAIAGFKAGTELEGYIDGLLDNMQRQAIEAQNNPQPPQPSPEEQKLQMEMQKSQMDAEIKMKEAEQKAQLEQQKMMLEVQQQQQELEFKRQMAALDLQIKQVELAQKSQESQMDMEIKQTSAVMDLEQKERSNEQKTRFAEEAAKNKGKES